MSVMTYTEHIREDWQHRSDVACPRTVCIPAWEPDHWVQVSATRNPALQEGEATPVSGVTSGVPSPEAPVTVQYIYQNAVAGTPTTYLKSSDGMRWQVEEYSRDGKTTFVVSVWMDNWGWEIVVHVEVAQRRGSSIEDAVRTARAILVG